MFKKVIISGCLMLRMSAHTAGNCRGRLLIKISTFPRVFSYSSLQLLAADSSSICPNVVVCLLLSVIKLKNCFACYLYANSLLIAC